VARLAAATMGASPGHRLNLMIEGTAFALATWTEAEPTADLGPAGLAATAARIPVTATRAATVVVTWSRFRGAGALACLPEPLI
jgi:hypothetical protein